MRHEVTCHVPADTLCGQTLDSEELPRIARELSSLLSAGELLRDAVQDTRLASVFDTVEETSPDEFAVGRLEGSLQLRDVGVASQRDLLPEVKEIRLPRERSIPLEVYEPVQTLGERGRQGPVEPRVETFEVL